MATVGQSRARLDDLYRESGKAELIGGRIVPLMATGRKPHQVAFSISRSLFGYAQHPFRRTRLTFPAHSRRTRCDSSKGPRTFAAEVRSETDYGDAAEAEMADKRADYFEAGTLVVWDGPKQPITK